MKEIPFAGLYEKALLVLGFRTVYRIEGDSMAPVLNNGEEVLVEEGAQVSIGDVVIARHPSKEGVEMAKRITAIDANGKFFLVGDNSDESTDSRRFGPVSLEYIKGKVTSRLGTVEPPDGK
ncbi:MAG: nickel-type superoxide dismutase maturation protease [Acidobacteriota bacterium]|nr:MAG: nickel-type superoxide dismutase maturation protease [Acidobacteriota bacterium]